ncbi:nucleoside hydrolase [Polycladidibacter hongkongensis]|uniref:nucleoside hydrolase n=1 Tax=Polycladidibacter hongkongensis TaxID=1647556 RepID=UPI00082FC3D4|nr:nucleoside hydrolase [Pseudovibrio hongkongensis]
MGKQKLILDVDTGTDDAVAVMLAALHPDLELVGVTTVNGNAEVRYCTENTLRVLDAIDRSDIPVFEGQRKPLVRDDFPVPRFDGDLTDKIHGKYLDVAPASSKKQQGHAVEFLVETYRNASEEIILVPVAPLTNIAAALVAEPKFADWVPRIVLMGGAHLHGNTTPSAEFNIWADPEAARIVFAAGFADITMVPLDATHKALVTLDDCKKLRSLGTAAGRLTAQFTEHRIGVHDEIQRMDIAHSAPVHDALCIAHLLHPEVITLEEHHVDVECEGRLTVGQTVIDTRKRGRGQPNCKVAFDADAGLFVDTLIKTFS